MTKDDLPVGVHITYSLEYRRCRKPNCAKCAEGRGGCQGPYWYAVEYKDGKRVKHYVRRSTPAEVAARQDARQATSAATAGLTTVSGREQGAPGWQSEGVLPLRVQTLGKFAVWRFGASISWRNSQAAALFKCLLGEEGQRLAREQVMEYLWPEGDLDKGPSSLRTTIHLVRQALVDESFLRSDGDYLQLVPNPALALANARQVGVSWLDWVAFKEAARQGVDGKDVVACRAALKLYGGNYLPDDLYTDWAIPRRNNLAQDLRRLLLSLVELCQAQGEMDEAETYLRRLLSEDPADEVAAEKLIRLQAEQGRWAEARRTYREVKGALKKDLAVLPGETLRKLHKDLVAEEARVRLASLPPQRPLPKRPTNLPVALTNFVGRVEDQEELVRYLITGEYADIPCHILTLTGEGGVGKTRLALKVAENILEDSLDNFPDGVWLAQLAATNASKMDDPTPVVRAVAVALGVKKEPGRELLETLIEFLSPYQCLLVLDNCEHLKAACSGFAKALLSSCTGLRILATSREVLGAEGEIAWRVPTLSVPTLSETSVAAVSQYDAVHLFIDRAQPVSSDFALSDQNAAVLGRICRQLDGIPLAIELAAARLRTLSVAALATRLDNNRFPLLTGGPRTMLLRQQTLRATLDWSYELLSGPEQTLLGRLAIFRGGWTLAAAETVCAGGWIETTEILDLLTALMDKSLLHRAPDEDKLRYGLLETIRQYAHERLIAAGEETTLGEQHLSWCVNVAEDAERHLTGAEQTAGLLRLQAEQDNFRAALAWVGEHGKDVGKRLLHLRLATALAPLWAISGDVKDGHMQLEQALASVPNVQSELKGRAFRGIGNLACALGDYDAAESHLKACLRLQRPKYGIPGRAHTLRDLGTVLKRKGNWRAARNYYRESRTLCEDVGDHWGLAAALTNLGIMALEHEQPEAGTLLEEVLVHWKELGDSRSIAATLNELGLLAQAEAKYPEAQELFEESLRIARVLGDTRRVANTLDNLGNLLVNQRDFGRGEECLNESLDLRKQIPDRRGQATSLGNLAESALKQGDLDLAERLHRESLDIKRVIGDKSDIAASLEGLAQAAGARQQRSDWERSSLLLGAASMLWPRLRNTPEYFTLFGVLGRYLGSRGRNVLLAKGRKLVRSDRLPEILEMVAGQARPTLDL